MIGGQTNQTVDLGAIAATGAVCLRSVLALPGEKQEGEVSGKPGSGWYQSMGITAGEKNLRRLAFEENS